MSGVIEGYNYDIFFSYRQKDNQPSPGYGWQSRGDSRVSESVERIKNPEAKSQTGDTIIIGNKPEKKKIPWSKIAVPAVILTAILVVFLLILYPLKKQ